MQMPNYYPVLSQLRFDRRYRIPQALCSFCLIFILSVLWIVLSSSGTYAIQKHQVYEESGASHAVSSYHYAEHGATQHEGRVLEYYPEKSRRRMGSGVSSHEAYTGGEEPYGRHETKVFPHVQRQEHFARPREHENVASSPAHRIAPIHEPQQETKTVAPKEKANHTEKMKHEPGAEIAKLHEAEREGEGEEHKVEISPIPGVTFVETFIRLLDHEINGRFLGWRPNDLIIGRFTDNINNFQLGLLEAARFTALRLKENLSRLGEADAYDQDLQMAVNLLMNKSTQFWFPSAEGSYNEAIKYLRSYLKRLKTGKAHFYYRVDTLIALISSYRDFLGNCTNNLVKDHEKDGTPVSWFKADDYFYYSQGAAYLIHEILKVVEVGFHEQLVTIDAVDIMEEAIHELHRGVSMSPWIILDRPLDSVFANHRANLGAVLGEATHLLSVMTQF